MHYRCFAIATIPRREIAVTKRIITSSVGSFASLREQSRQAVQGQRVYLLPNRCLEIRDAQTHLE
jgi:hypothetical protein